VPAVHTLAMQTNGTLIGRDDIDVLARRHRLP
jgi:hypothetical protein